jgi:hypothetical protein
MRTLHTILFSILILALVSCEKVIDIDIRDADRKYVIEGVVTNEGLCEVRLSQSVHFNDPSVFPDVSGAQVIVYDNGVPHVLPEILPGLYRTGTVPGTPGHAYDLFVQIGDEIFTARSKMLAPVPIDTLYIGTGFFGSYKFPFVGYTDPAGINNGYRFIQYKNRIRDPAIFWDNDEFTDGQSNLVRLDNGVSSDTDPRAIHTGDTVRVELLSLDDPIYRFWSTIEFGGAGGSAFSASPANPVSNIEGGALGYFSAHSITRRTVISW